MPRWLLILALFLLSCADPPTPRAPEPEKRPASPVVVEAPTPTSEQVPVHADDPSLGPKTAPVTIVMWSDFQCPYCSRVKPTIQKLRARYGDQLRVVWKDLPLSFHKYAREAAVVARIAYLERGNDAFWQMHDRIFDNQSSLSTDSLVAMAADAGIGSGALETFRAEAEARVDRAIAESQALAINGTPAFYIDGQLISGAQKLEKFVAVIDAHLAKAKELTAQGVAPGDLYAALVKAFWEAPVAEEPEPEPPIDPTVWEAQVGAAPVRGPKNALVTLVTFADFQCPFCKRLATTLAQLEKEYPGKLRFVFKDKPLSFHDQAMPAAHAAREIRKQKGDDAFWKFHDAVLAAPAKLTDGDLETYAAAIPGVDVKKVRAAIDAQRYDGDIDKDVEQAELLEVSGTPHTFVNGRSLSGSQPLAKWKLLVDEELAKAEAKVKAGTAPEKLYEETIKGGKMLRPLDLKVPADAPFRGGAKAKVVLQVFSEFQCPFCRRFARVVPDATDTGTLERLEKRYGDKIKIVWRDFPLGFHPRARAAAAFAREAKKQKGLATFWKVHDELFDLAGVLDDEKLEELAKRHGIDWVKARAAIASGVHDAAIDADQQAGTAAGVTGTPATFVNGRLVSGAQPDSAYIKLIDRALAKK